MPKNNDPKKLNKIIHKEFDRLFKENVEVKFHNNSLSNLAISGIGTSFDLTVISQGLLDSNRIGDTIRVSDINIRGHVNVNDSFTSNSCRLLLVQWHNINDAVTGLPFYADLWNSSYSGTNQAPYSPYNQDQLSARRVLYDRTFSVNSEVKRIPFTIDMQNVKLRKTQYQASNALYKADGVMLFMVSDDVTAAAASQPRVTYVSHIKYTDA